MFNFIVGETVLKFQKEMDISTEPLHQCFDHLLCRVFHAIEEGHW